MIRNYNGNVNRSVLRDLRKLCNLNAENERNLFEAFDRDGEVSVYENLDPFTGCPDEMSTIVTMKSDKEVKEYLKKDFLKRVNGYLKDRNPEEDYLLNALIEFIKEHGRFPEKEGMSQLEKEAEAKRVAELPADNVTIPKEMTDEEIAKEILELSEEIMESRRENHPEDIRVPVEPYPESLWFETDKFQGSILYARYYGKKDFTDYSLAIQIKGYNRVDTIAINYWSDGTACITVKDRRDNELEESVTDYIVNIHKDIVEMAKKEGIEFTSEIDYENVVKE